jgi:hypothetical protein
MGKPMPTEMLEKWLRESAWSKASKSALGVS